MVRLCERVHYLAVTGGDNGDTVGRVKDGSRIPDLSNSWPLNWDWGVGP